MITVRRTRSQVTDEDMVVALSVGACPGGALEAPWQRCPLKGLLEQFDETLSKRVFTTKMQKRFRRPFFSDLKALSHRERMGAKVSSA
jgi:hypothetical protein